MIKKLIAAANKVADFASQLTEMTQAEKEEEYDKGYEDGRKDGIEAGWGMAREMLTPRSPVYVKPSKVVMPLTFDIA